MDDNYYSVCYWSERMQSLDECVHRAEALFQGLAKLDPVFTRWFEKAGSRKKALQSEGKPMANVLRELFSRKYKTGLRSYSFAVWNGQDDENAVSVSLFCGWTG